MKIIILGLVMFLMLTIAVPVMATPTSGQKVEVTQITGSTIATPTICIHDGVTYPYTGSNRLTPGEVASHRRDYGQVMNNQLIIHYSTGDVTLNGLAFANYDRSINFFGNYPVLTGIMMVYHYDAIWEYQPQTGLLQYGGFEGNLDLLITEYNPGPPASYQAKFRFVLQGFGAFEGQTIQFSYSGAIGQPWEGYLLKA